MFSAQILALKGVKLFNNDRDTVEVKLGKESRVKAAYSYFNQEQGYDLRISPVVTAASGREYIKSTLSLSQDGQRRYFNGILNAVKKVGSDFLYAGHIDVGEGERVKMFVKKPTEKGFFPVSFSKDTARSEDSSSFVQGNNFDSNVVPF